MVGEVGYVKIDTPELLQVYLHSFVRCYQNVYAAAPWNEWMKCPQCEKNWGISQSSILAKINFRHCGMIIGDYWPTEYLVVKANEWRKIPGCSFWIAVVGAEVVGFGIGYPRTVDDLQARELQLDLPGFYAWGVEGRTRVAYLKDVGILPEYRGSGIFQGLNKRRFHDLLQVQQLPIISCRTQKEPEPTVTYNKYLASGFSVVAEYEKKGDQVRVFMACKASDLRGSLAEFHRPP